MIIYVHSESEARIWSQWGAFAPRPGGLGFCPFWGGGSVVVDFLFVVATVVGVCICFMFCCTLLYVHSSIAMILLGRGELVALLGLSSWCLVVVGWLFLAVPWGCLWFVIVVFPDHTHLLFEILYLTETHFDQRLCISFPAMYNL